MAEKIQRSSPAGRSDVRTDYALIGMAAGATVLALLYLILL